MRRIFFQIGSLLMALCVLFVTHGLSINFHLCLEEHHVISSFGDASKLCEHCLGHHHHEHLDIHEFEEHNEVVHFESKCCCEDFDSKVGFTDDFTFSSEKTLTVFLPFTLLAQSVDDIINNDPITIFRSFAQLKIPYLFTGRLKTIFFSNLKLNPLVF